VNNGPAEDINLSKRVILAVVSVRPSVRPSNCPPVCPSGVEENELGLRFDFRHSYIMSASLR
jgi:hypothetical protein